MLLLCALSLHSAPAWDTYSDTWVASDALGRAVPTHPAVAEPRGERTVGMFYFLWLGEHIQGAGSTERKPAAATASPTRSCRSVNSAEEWYASARGTPKSPEPPACGTGPHIPAGRELH